MCTTVYSSLLLIILYVATIYMMCGAKMRTEGLPLYRWERGTDEDILSGADFLSVLMRSSSSHYQSNMEVSTKFTTNDPVTLHSTTTDNRVLVRNSRSTPYLPDNAEKPEITSLGYNGSPLQSIEYNTANSVRDESSPPSSESNAVVVAVHVSTSVGRTESNETLGKRDNLDVSSDSSIYSNIDLPLPTPYNDQNAVLSEEHPGIVAEISKSELSIEQGEPITTDTDTADMDFNSYPANVRPLPRPTSLNDKLPPLRDTVIFHDNPREPSRARSVSYSAVIQSIPHLASDKNPWDKEKETNLDRHERHFDGTQPSFNNAFTVHADQEKNATKSSPSVAETNHFYVTSNPENEQSLEKSWEEPKVYSQEITTTRPVETTEKNWEHTEKQYTPPQPRLPQVYAQPEQNYEVDEAVSVVSNGRVHGVQRNPTQKLPQQEPNEQDSSKKSDGSQKDQKVGYVVEGRNYRKYRVEERTSDGFIVGEYGVVSHDDGSLRGVRYTADGTINPRLIYDALMKFLSL